MSVPITTAEGVLRARLGEPEKEVKYVLGFTTARGKVLALHRTASETRLWFVPPAPPKIDGVFLMPTSAKNDDLNGQFAPLNTSSALRVEIATEGGLNRFLDWYAASSTGAVQSSHGARGSKLSSNFSTLYQRFQQLVTARTKGHPFTSFQEGLAAS